MWLTKCSKRYTQYCALDLWGKKSENNVDPLCLQTTPLLKTANVENSRSQTGLPAPYPSVSPLLPTTTILLSSVDARLAEGKALVGRAG